MTSAVQQMRSASAIDLQERFGKKKLFFVLAAAQAVLLLCILLFCSIKYEVSDDFIMEMVVSGAYTGHPDAHMMFSNIFIGWLFVPLYSLFPAISLAANAALLFVFSCAHLCTCAETSSWHSGSDCCLDYSLCRT